MALRGALVDRAYKVDQRGTGRKVDGRTIFKPAEGTRFRARLSLSAGAPERSAQGETYVEPRPMLLTGIRDDDGNPLSFSNADRIRVVSKELGEDTWDVDSEPEPLRKKRRLIGWQLQLMRVKEPTRS